MAILGRYLFGACRLCRVLTRKKQQESRWNTLAEFVIQLVAEVADISGNVAELS